MSKTSTTTSIALGDDPMQVRTYEARPRQQAFAVISLGGSGIYVHTAEQAYALVKAAGQALAFLEDAGLQADFQAQQARDALASA